MIDMFCFIPEKWVTTICARSEVFTAVLLKIQVLWDVKHCVCGVMVPIIVKDHNAFIFRVK
jgi:hypothetical protein